LAKVLPPDSSDVRIIDANLAEDMSAAGAATTPVADASVAGSSVADSSNAPRGASISGTVDIDPKLRALAAAGATLFVFAKSVDSPGPPLAVMRLTVDRWPVKFLLNDAQAMLPQRKLSDFRKVKVEARIAAHGQPTAQAGDLQGATGALDAHDEPQIRIVIDQVIG
jgi:cytochrome c-type biogenesis protein CcmH